MVHSSLHLPSIFVTSLVSKSVKTNACLITTGRAAFYKIYRFATENLRVIITKLSEIIIICFISVIIIIIFYAGGFSLVRTQNLQIITTILQTLSLALIGQKNARIQEAKKHFSMQ